MDFPIRLEFGNDTDRIIEEDFPENRADTDFFTFYFFAVVYPIAALLTVAHLILHGVPVLGFILSLAVSLSCIVWLSSHVHNNNYYEHIIV